MLTVLHGTSNANIEPLFLRINFVGLCNSHILYVVYVVL